MRKQTYGMRKHNCSKENILRRILRIRTGQRQVPLMQPKTFDRRKPKIAPQKEKVMAADVHQLVITYLPNFG